MPLDEGYLGRCWGVRCVWLSRKLSSYLILLLLHSLQTLVTIIGHLHVDHHETHLLSSDAFHLSQIGVSGPDLNALRHVLFVLEYLLRMACAVLLYLSIFLATYHRVAIYVDTASRVWLFKKIGDGVLLGTWAILLITEVGLVLTPGPYTADANSLHSATSSFFVLMNIAGIVGTIMLNKASNSQKAQDLVVWTLFRWLLPALAFRAIWAMITARIGNIDGVFQFDKGSESYLLADVIVDRSSLAIFNAVMIRLGFRDVFWDIPDGVTAPFGSGSKEQGGQRKVRGMTVLIGPNGFPVLQPNGQPLYVPVSPIPAGAVSLEPSIYQSIYSPATDYQQQDVLPYDQPMSQAQSDAYSGSRTFINFQSHTSTSLLD